MYNENIKDKKHSTKLSKTKKNISIEDLTNTKEKIEVFHQFHHNNDILLLPNAWDAISAKIFEKEGARAIGTTSAGIAAVLGYPDGQLIPKYLFLQTVERIISSVHVPVSVDLEAGYGETVSDICDTVQKVTDMGAVGINIEDTDPQTNQLIPIIYQVNRIRAIRKLANKNNLPLFINARTDVYWASNVPSEKRYEETLCRLLAYKEARADGLFVPGLTDISVITNLCNKTRLPLNVLGGAWITSINALKNAGIARISIGSGIFRVAATSTREACHQFVQGNFSFLKDSIPYDFVNNLFK